ncbi:MAG TPA: AsnC family transcriptional regulator [Clostridium sp.]|jgi:DNA-binding Lrp family transcriptional regulator|nr:Lrp/AsnC family transcriptional regulator [Clostridia bacterium]HCW04874.1 AsnC family transcriptional regulator [Clostridium sp.]
MEEILEILEKNSRLSNEEIAVMVGKTAEEVEAAIKNYDKQNVIVGYTALINHENTNDETVTALIEVKVTPQRGEGFDKVAEKIYRFTEVKACYLMSGGFDLTVIVEGRSMKEVALFVAEKLATLDSVISCSTHFVLKKYKDKGTIFEKKAVDDREAIYI